MPGVELGSQTSEKCALQSVIYSFVLCEQQLECRRTIHTVYSKCLYEPYTVYSIRTYEDTVYSIRTYEDTGERGSV